MKYYLFLSLCLVCLFAEAQVPNYVSTDGLVGWYPFNGNANDESDTGNNGTVNGATLTQDRFGATNAAYSFDGVNDYIQVPNSASLESSNLTLSFWVQTFNSQFQQVIYKVTPMTAANETYSVPLNLNQANTINFDLKSNSCTAGQGWVFTNANSGDLLDWTNFVVSHDGEYTKIYKNGELLISSLAQFPINNCPGGSVLFGSDWQYNNLLSGFLDDIGIWNRALTEEEIQNLYTANICYDHVTVTDTLLINFNMTGFNPVTYQHSIQIFPNPTNDQITINYGDFVGLNGYTLSIFNAMGQLVYTSNITQQQEYLDLNSWGGIGVYQVVVYSPQGVPIETRQIVLQ
jgi:hypothetical protein